MMRLFVAIRLEDSCKDVLCSAIAGLRAHARHGNFSRRDNLHLTLAFIGETGRLEAAKRAVEAIRSDSFSLELSRLGRFRRSGGDIWWMGIAENASLADLHAQVRDALEDEGFPIENRPFSPHLTLGREIILEPGFDPASLAHTFPSARMQVKEIALMESRRVHGALQYMPRFVKPLMD